MKPKKKNIILFFFFFFLTNPNSSLKGLLCSFLSISEPSLPDSVGQECLYTYFSRSIDAVTPQREKKKPTTDATSVKNIRKDGWTEDEALELYKYYVGGALNSLQLLSAGHYR